MPRQSLPSVDDVPTIVASHEPVLPLPPVPPTGWYPRRVDVKLPPRHRQLMRETVRKLQDAGEKLEDGTAVTDMAKAVLWLLEKEGKTR